MFVAMFPTRQTLFGISLQQEPMIGTVSFLKGSEGFFESYPQAMFQISIVMREEWPPSKFVDI